MFGLGPNVRRISVPQNTASEVATESVDQRIFQSRKIAI
jgi:hypothetical protein